MSNLTISRECCTRVEFHFAPNPSSYTQSKAANYVPFAYLDYLEAAILTIYSDPIVVKYAVRYRPMMLPG